MPYKKIGSAYTFYTFFGHTHIYREGTHGGIVCLFPYKGNFVKKYKKYKYR